MLVLPTFFVLGFLANYFFNFFIVSFNLSNDLVTGLGIFFLILHIAPPPPNKKKRILFIQKLKALFKRFYKQSPTDDIIFTDDVVRFAEYTQTSTASNYNPQNQDNFLDTIPKWYEKFPVNPQCRLLKHTTYLNSIADYNEIGLIKADLRTFLSNFENNLKNFNFKYIFDQLPQYKSYFGEEGSKEGLNNIKENDCSFLDQIETIKNKKGVFNG